MATVRVPGSKSTTARALFLSACADGLSTLRHPLVSDDTEAFAEGLGALGYPVHRSAEEWSVLGRVSGPSAREARVFCRDAGTAARFLPALAATGHGTCHFDASEQMRRRPVAPLVTALRALGARVRHLGADGHLPIAVTSDGIEGGGITMDAGLSSQFLTAVLMVGPLTRDGLRVTVTDLVSEPYVDMTIALMREFGATVHREGAHFDIAPTGYTARTHTIEPDASTSSYFFAAAALTGNRVTVPGLGAGSRQGDTDFVRVLGLMGAHAEIGEDSITVAGTGRLRGIEVNMRDISDTMPTLAAIAPFAEGPVRITDVYNTRVKESDRLDACAENLRRLGVPVTEGRDWIEVSPAPPRPVVIDCRDDHRIAMSFSITGLLTPGLKLDNPECVRKTFPGFHRALATLRSQWAQGAAAAPGR
ncbi:3-phosphoshikimate 1-carboxyvinyltransferase [Embleya scabrispora]|uniref:3-phosphoshikimate 1-carboxyvinyltransferase n=1 Tax=Embleya scabrispora TaxID=159449 RepID=UPI00039E2EEF|nr:3-phosphoshikimate 1-carboxyvinyltransferase [Embleya scabrispora]MYS86250.1 3-phosphoshikimate 1-carboxyvinyltransferase [Streptomyces sp. SID5474]